MINLELTRFNVYVLANGMDYLTLVDIKEKLANVKASMEESRARLIELTQGRKTTGISSIETQLEIVNHNVKAVDEATKMKEAEPFEHWREFEKLGLQIFCLN